MTLSIKMLILRELYYSNDKRLHFDLIKENLNIGSTIQAINKAKLELIKKGFIKILNKILILTENGEEEAIKNNIVKIKPPNLEMENFKPSINENQNRDFLIKNKFKKLNQVENKVEKIKPNSTQKKDLYFKIVDFYNQKLNQETNLIDYLIKETNLKKSRIYKLLADLRQKNILNYRNEPHNIEIEKQENLIYNQEKKIFQKVESSSSSSISKITNNKLKQTNKPILNQVENKGVGQTQEENQFRLHNNHFEAKIKGVLSHTYQQQLKLKNNLQIIQFEDTKLNIRLFEKEIQVLFSKSFQAQTISEVENQRTKFFIEILQFLENKFNINLISNSHTFLKVFRGENAKENEILAKNLKNNHFYFTLIGKDGKGWLLIDKSRGFELETIHNLNHNLDMSKILTHLEDFKTNEEKINWFNDYGEDFKKVFSNWREEKALTPKVLTNKTKNNEIDLKNLKDISNNLVEYIKDNTSFSNSQLNNFKKIENIVNSLTQTISFMNLKVMGQDREIQELKSKFD